MMYKTSNILKLFILLWGTLILNLRAATILWVTHPQVGHDLNQMAELYRDRAAQSPPFKAKEIFPLLDSTDIHQFSPSPIQLKRLLKYTPLIIGPLSHQPWLKLAKTSGLLAHKKMLILDQLGPTDHYWLNASMAVVFEKKIQSFLKQLAIPYPNTSPWSDKIIIENNKIKKIINNKHITKIVLTHNSLSSLFKGMNNIELLTLYSDDHHQQVSASQLKKLYRWAKKPNEVLFIFEKNLVRPTVLTQEKLFERIKTIEWSPIGTSPLMKLREVLEHAL